MEQALSDAFHIGYESAIKGLENTLYHFVEGVLTEMTQRVALDEVFNI